MELQIIKLRNPKVLGMVRQTVRQSDGWIDEWSGPKIRDAHLQCVNNHYMYRKFESKGMKTFATTDYTN